MAVIYSCLCTHLFLKQISFGTFKCWCCGWPRFGEKMDVLWVVAAGEALQRAFPVGMPGSGLTSARRTPQRCVSCSSCAAVCAALPVYLYLDFKHILLSASWFEVQNFKC